jgi:hypothetical protein
MPKPVLVAHLTGRAGVLPGHLPLAPLTYPPYLRLHTLGTYITNKT